MEYITIYKSNGERVVTTDQVILTGEYKTTEGDIAIAGVDNDYVWNEKKGEWTERVPINLTVQELKALELSDIRKLCITANIVCLNLPNNDVLTINTSWGNYYVNERDEGVSNEWIETIQVEFGLYTTTPTVGYDTGEYLHPNYYHETIGIELFSPEDLDLAVAAFMERGLSDKPECVSDSKKSCGLSEILSKQLVRYTTP